MKMLKRLSDRIWYYPMEEERDRPNLGYIRGDNWSLAVDAGHSEAHTREFYEALEENGLPLPKLTVITHWHWDHTFGMHAVNGLCLANERTNEYLLDFKRRLSQEGNEFFLNMHESIRNEYSYNKPVIVTPADIVFHDSMVLDAGNCPIKIFQAESPHTDDSTLIEISQEGVLDNLLTDETMEFRITNDGNEADIAEIYKMLKGYNLSNREKSENVPLGIFLMMKMEINKPDLQLILLVSGFVSIISLFQKNFEDMVSEKNSSKQLKKRQSSEAVNMSLLIHFLSKHLGFTQSWAIKKYSRYKNILTPEPDITTRKNYKFQAY